MTSRVQRIVVFAPHFAEYAMRLAMGLASRGVIVLLIVDDVNVAQECDAALRREARTAGVQVLTFGSVGRSARARSLLRIMGRIALFQPDIIHVQEQIDSLTAWVCRLAGRLYPILLTVHDPRPHSGTDAAYAAVNAGNRRAIRAMARGFHVHGAVCRDELIAELGRARPIVATQHGVLLVPGAADRREPEPGLILMFGRMEAYKGLDLLLDAVEDLRKRGVALRLVLAGRGSELERLVVPIARLPQTDVVLDRFIPPDEVVALFQRASVVVAPYRNATQSGIVAAAFGNGRPVLASRAGGLVDAVADGTNGILVPAGDAAALADGLAAILADPTRLARLSEGAQQAARTEFSWPHIAGLIARFATEHLVSPARRP